MTKPFRLTLSGCGLRWRLPAPGVSIGLLRLRVSIGHQSSQQVRLVSSERDTGSKGKSVRSRLRGRPGDRALCPVHVSISFDQDANALIGLQKLCRHHTGPSGRQFHQCNPGAIQHSLRSLLHSNPAYSPGRGTTKWRRHVDQGPTIGRGPEAVRPSPLLGQHPYVHVTEIRVGSKVVHQCQPFGRRGEELLEHHDPGPLACDDVDCASGISVRQGDEVCRRRDDFAPAGDEVLRCDEYRRIVFRISWVQVLGVGGRHVTSLAVR